MKIGGQSALDLVWGLTWTLQNHFN